MRHAFIGPKKNLIGLDILANVDNAAWFTLSKFFQPFTVLPWHVWDAVCAIIQNFLNLTWNADIYEKDWYLWAYIYIGIYAQYWYLCTILVVKHDTGIYKWYWYLCTILVFMHDTGVYMQYLYMMMVFIYMQYCYLCTVLVFMCDSGIYV